MSFTRSEKGGIVYGIFVLVLLLLGGASVPFFIFGETVKPNEVGVRRNYFAVWPFLRKGFEENGLSPGLHFQIPGVSNVITIPRSFLLVNLNEGHEGGDLDKGELLIPTTDGSKVKTDVALIVRLYESPSKESAAAVGTQETSGGVPLAVRQPRSHGGPFELISAYALSPIQQLETIARISENELKKALSSLSTSDYYDPRRRESAAIAANAAVNNIVASNGVEMWAVLVRRYVYADERIDNQIFEKNLEDQTRRLNASAGQLSAARATTEKVRALWDAKIRDLEVQGQTTAKVLQSEGDLYEAKKHAEGDLLVAKATAEVDAAKAGVLSEVSGSEVYVAREMTPFLRSLAGGVVTDLDPYDLDRWMERFTGTRGIQ